MMEQKQPNIVSHKLPGSNQEFDDPLDSDLEDLFLSVEFHESLARVEMEFYANEERSSQIIQSFPSPPPPALPSPPPAPSLLSRKFRKGFLSVSDFAKLQWCEQQVFYAVVGRPKVETSATKRKEVAKQAGTDLHKKIEEVIVGPTVVIETKTKEDRWAVM